MKTPLLVLSVLLSTLLSTSLLAFDIHSFNTEYTDLQQTEAQLFGLDKAGKYHPLTLNAGTLVSSKAILLKAPARPDDILSDGRLVIGNGKINRAWLGGPTRRYDHGVMLDIVEATRLYAQLAGGDIISHKLPYRFVYEDRFPRLADLDGDGELELIVIRTNTKTGAGIAVYGVKEGKLVLEAASKTIGLANRWLNIVGIEDFNGDGIQEIAAVITPHISGKLTLFQQRGKKLIAVVAQDGYSNHQYGSRELGMSAALDIDADGVMDMAVPDTDRKNLILLTATNNQFEKLAEIENQTGINSGIYTAELDDDLQPELVYLLKDGTLKVIDF